MALRPIATVVVAVALSACTPEPEPVAAEHDHDHETTAAGPVPSAPESAPEPEPKPEPEPVMEPRVLLASAPPVDSPVTQTRREVYTLPDATLTHLASGRQYLLERGDRTHHLEAGRPIVVRPDGTVLVGGEPCALVLPERSNGAYQSVCPGLWRRNLVVGRKSQLEWATEVVRDRFAGGEKITTFVKKVTHDRGRKVSAQVEVADVEAARPAPVAATQHGRGLQPRTLGIPLVGSPASLATGRFYAVDGPAGVWIAATSVGATPAGPGLSTDTVEQDADVYLVLFELEHYTIDYTVGTEHPSLGWADRVVRSQRTTRPGPDGFALSGPLVPVGVVPPDRANRIVSTFTAGFKRSHGAFHQGALSLTHRGSHYGFVEEGIVWSQPQPGLATVAVDWKGDVTMFTWKESDRVETFRHVRQNGSPLVEKGAVGPLVTNLRDGNWSGSVEGNARSMRGGLCVRGKELLYGYFTSATPSGMARVFIAAGCDTAMLLDMNALEHTYLAVYAPMAGGVRTYNLDTGMAVLDHMRKDRSVLPRFLALPDNRDFFSVRPRTP